MIGTEDADRTGPLSAQSQTRREKHRRRGFRQDAEDEMPVGNLFQHNRE
jgi:hypothetical protein